MTINFTKDFLRSLYTKLSLSNFLSLMICLMHSIIKATLTAIGIANQKAIRANKSIRYKTPFVLGVPVRGFLATARLNATANALNDASAM